MRAPTLLCAALFGLVAACGGNPAPGDPGYPYNVEGRYAGRLTVGAIEYEAVIRMETAADGTVSGSLGAARLDGPSEEPSRSLDGDFSGTLQDDILVWRSSWVVPSTGCSGILRGRGPVESGGSALEGEARMAGDCMGAAAGRYRLTR